MVARGGNIDRRVYRSRRGNELELGKALNDVAGQRGPLAHDTNDIKKAATAQLRRPDRRGGHEYGDVRSIAEHRPIGALQRHILVIVQNSDLVANTRTIRISNRRSEGRDKGEVTSRVLEVIIATSPLRSARSSNS